MAFLSASSSKKEPHYRCVPVNFRDIFRTGAFRE